MAGGVKGLDSLLKKVGELGTAVAGDTMVKAVHASCRLVQGEAKLLCPVDSGALRGSIRVSVEEQGDMVEGCIFTNMEYAPYVEFGTGPVGEANHTGVSPQVDLSYSQTGWKTPFGYTEGQSAQPFLYPALKDNEERVKRNIANYISREIRKACKND